MIINAKKTYSFLFVIVLLSQLYTPSFRYNIILQIMVLAFISFYGKPIISNSFFNKIIPILLIVIFGFMPTLFNDYGKMNIIKDFTHIIKPVVGIVLGYLIFKQINDYRAFVKIIIVTGFFCAIYHLIRILIFVNVSESVNDLRLSGLDNFLELFALFFVFFTPKLFKEKLFKNNLYQNGIKFVLVASCFLYFSRTMIVVFGIIMLSIYGYTKLTIRSLKIIGIGVILLGMFYAYLFSIKIDRSGTGLETFFYKIKNAPVELFKTKIDRENHQDLWDHWRGYEAKRAFALMQKKPYSYAVGTGYGSLVNLKFKAPLGDSKNGMRYISELHNGYAYIIYKTGILGLVLLLFFLYKLYRFIYKRTNNRQHEFLLKIISSIGLLYVFTTLTITGIYNQSDVIIILLGSLLFFERKLSLENREKGT